MSTLLVVQQNIICLQALQGSAKKACHRISLQGKKGKASGSILSDERASASESRDTTNGKRRIILDLR